MRISRAIPLCLALALSSFSATAAEFLRCGVAAPVSGWTVKFSCTLDNRGVPSAGADVKICAAGTDCKVASNVVTLASVPLGKPTQFNATYAVKLSGCVGSDAEGNAAGCFADIAYNDSAASLTSAGTATTVAGAVTVGERLGAQLSHGNPATGPQSAAVLADTGANNTVVAGTIPSSHDVAVRTKIDTTFTARCDGPVAIGPNALMVKVTECAKGPSGGGNVTEFKLQKCVATEVGSCKNFSETSPKSAMSVGATTLASPTLSLNSVSCDDKGLCSFRAYGYKQTDVQSTDFSGAGANAALTSTGYASIQGTLNSDAYATQLGATASQFQACQQGNLDGVTGSGRVKTCNGAQTAVVGAVSGPACGEQRVCSESTTLSTNWNETCVADASTASIQCSGVWPTKDCAVAATKDPQAYACTANRSLRCTLSGSVSGCDKKEDANVRWRSLVSTGPCEGYVSRTVNYMGPIYSAVTSNDSRAVSSLTYGGFSARYWPYEPVNFPNWDPVYRYKIGPVMPGQPHTGGLFLYDRTDSYDSGGCGINPMISKWDMTFSQAESNPAQGLYIEAYKNQWTDAYNPQVIVNGQVLAPVARKTYQYYNSNVISDVYVVDRLIDGINSITLSSTLRTAQAKFDNSLGYQFIIVPISGCSVTCTDSWDTELTDKHGRPSSTNHDQDIPCDVFEDCGPDNPC